jgi:hypothetical protein
MPKRKVGRTAKQRAASRRNLVKARAARKQKPIGKSGLPHIQTITRREGGRKFVYVRTLSKGKVTGELSGQIWAGSKRLDIWSVEKKQSPFSYKPPIAPTLEPGISLLTGAARAARANGKTTRMKVHIGTNDAFYTLTGGKHRDAMNYTYSPAAMKKLANRRVIRVRGRNLT